jgi:hypothetical protein
VHHLSVQAVQHDRQIEYVVGIPKELVAEIGQIPGGLRFAFLRNDGEPGFRGVVLTGSGIFLMTDPAFTHYHDAVRKTTIAVAEALMEYHGNLACLPQA